MADMLNLSDEVVEQAAAGNENAVDAIMQHVSPQVYRMATVRLSPQPHQWHAIDEIVQESMIAILKALPELKIRTVAGFRGYLSRIVDNKVIDCIRRENKPGQRTGSLKSLNSTVANISSHGQFGQFLSASGIGPRTALEEHEHMQHMLEQFAMLKEEHRQVITFAMFDQLKTAEIAERMEISRPAASMLLIRALNALRKRMDTTEDQGEQGDAW